MVVGDTWITIRCKVVVLVFFMRTKQNYLSIMDASGFVSIMDDLFVTPHQRMFWIQGIVVNKE